MRLELKGPSRKWAIVMFAVGAVIGALDAAIRRELNPSLIVIVGVVVVILSVLSEALYWHINYVIFHEDGFDVSEDSWGLRKYGSGRRKVRVPYRDLLDIRTRDDVTEVDFRIDPLERRWSWPDVEYHGRLATLRFKPRDPETFASEVTSRVQRATKKESPE